MIRKEEYFKKSELQFDKCISLAPKKLYPQERDWTCSIACIRTLLSGILDDVESEDYYIDKYNMSPSPYYSKDIKALGILKEHNVKYGCDYSNIKFKDILHMLKDNCYIMLESMINYSHWIVLLGYYTFGDSDDIEQSRITIYEPYYNEIRIVNLDEFIGMWIDGNHETNGVEKDFIAIKASDK